MHGQANSELVEVHGGPRQFGSVNFAFVGKKTWRRPWHVHYNMQFVAWQCLCHPSIVHGG